MQLRIAGIRLLIVLLILGVWTAVTHFNLVSSDNLPSPLAIVRELVVLFQSSEFTRHAWVTITRIVVAFAFAVPIGILMGVALSETISVRKTLRGFVYFAMSIPQSIFLPLFILIFGIGFVQKVVFGATHAVFVIAINTASAIRSVPPSYLLAARSFGASRGQTYRVFYAPAMLPIVLTGLRLGLIFDVIGVLLAEMYASREGLGMLIFSWGEALRTREMLACILLVSGFTIAVNELFRLPETYFDRWRLMEAKR